MRILEAEGYSILTVEARSKKGVDNGIDKRVIRQRSIDEKTIELVFSAFKTDCCENKEKMVTE